MIKHEVEQGTYEWHQLRLGIPTASRFGQLITKTGKLSSQSKGYLNELVAEWLLGEPIDGWESPWMQRGSALELEAVKFYELQHDVVCEKVGFITSDDGTMGCSPDRLVGDNSGVEIKCPSAAVHVGYMRGVPHDQYLPQIMGCMMITGASSWDFLSYNPVLPPVLHRYERDQAYIEILSDIVTGFVEDLSFASSELAEHKCEAPPPAEEVVPFF